MALLKEKIARLREAQHLSQEDLAKKAGVSQPTIQHLESGRNRGSRYLVKIAAALGVDPRYLEDDNADYPPPQETNPEHAPTPAYKIPVLPWPVVHKHNSSEARNQAIEWVTVPQQTSRTFAVFADSESHYGSRELPLAPGQTLVIDPDMTKETVRALGRQVFAIIHTQSGDNLLRKITAEGTREYMHPLNPLFAPEPVPEGATIVGIVVAIHLQLAVNL